jgi:lysophospholipase L1-like esterase
VLEAQLHASHIPAEVLNASAGSWAIGNERAYIEKFGDFGSQLAVLEIGSDDLIQMTSTSAPVGRDPAYPDRNPPAALIELFQRYLIPRLAGGQSAPPATRAENDAQFTRNMDEFTREVALLQAAGTTVLVVHPPNRDEVVAEGGINPIRYSNYYGEYRAAFRALAGKLGVPVVDLSAEWKEVPDAAGYFRDGTHLSVAGDRAVGERLASEVQQLIASRTNAAPSLQ